MPTAEFAKDFLALVQELFVPVAVAILVLGGCGALLLKFGGVSGRSNLTFLIAFSALGAVPGLIAGWSQEPITGALLTGMLGLVSAMLTYLFGQASLEAFRPVIPVLMLVLLIGAILGLGIGGIHKKKWDEYEERYADYRAIHDQVSVVVERERQLMEWRQKFRIDNDGKRLTKDGDPVAPSPSTR